MIPADRVWFPDSLSPKGKNRVSLWYKLGGRTERVYAYSRSEIRASWKSEYWTTVQARRQVSGCVVFPNVSETMALEIVAVFVRLVADGVPLDRTYYDERAKTLSIFLGSAIKTSLLTQKEALLASQIPAILKNRPKRVPLFAEEFIPGDFK